MSMVPSGLWPIGMNGLVDVITRRGTFRLAGLPRPSDNPVWTLVDFRKDTRTEWGREALGPSSDLSQPVRYLTEIRQAYERLRGLLDQEILNGRGEAPTLERYRQWLDTAFYLLAWGNFEYLTRKQAEAVATEGARGHGRVKHAWSFLLERIKD